MALASGLRAIRDHFFQSLMPIPTALTARRFVYFKPQPSTQQEPIRVANCPMGILDHCLYIFLSVQITMVDSSLAGLEGRPEVTFFFSLTAIDVLLSYHGRSWGGPLPWCTIL